MLVRIFASSALLASSSLAELLTATREAPDPTITRAPDIPIELLRKQAVNDRFIGWVSLDGDWISRTCEVGGTYFQSDEYWRCCATTVDGCNVPIGCVGGSLVYSLRTSSSLSFTTRACTEVYGDDPDATSWSMCNTGLMYENTLDFDPVTNVFCGASASRWTYYRVRPTETSSSSSSESSTSPSSTPTSTSAGSTDTNTAGSATSTSDPTPIPQPTKSKSKAWIAGAVVGPVVGLALIGLLAWFLLSRRKKTSTPPPPPMQQQQQHHGAPAPYPGSPAQPPTNYYDAQKPNAFPVGVASHQSWAAPPPQSPTSQGSVSPHVPPQSPYGQQWQPVQGQQVYQGPSPSQSPPPQVYAGSHPSQSPPPQNVQAYHVGQEGKSPGVGYGERPFSAELDGGGQQPVR